MKNFSPASWREVIKSRAFKGHLAIVFIILLTIAFTIGQFFAYIQGRPGIRMDDPMLASITPRDLSSYIFLLVYGGIGWGLFRAIKFPVLFLRLIQAYCLLTVIRVTTLWVVPLESPDSIVPLTDPIIDIFFYANRVITKDLFFSGHVATIFLFVFAIPNKMDKIIFTVVAILLAMLLLVQHAHYTIDIAAAPFFSWASYRTSWFIDNAIERRFGEQAR